MKTSFDDLIDFNRTNLGLGIYIAPVSVDLADLFAEALEQLRVSRPGRRIELQVIGDVRGIWDPPRLHQLLCNLALNALQYGAHDAPVRVMLVGLSAEVEFSVHSHGRMIERSTLDYIFEPSVRGKEARSSSATDRSLGLGLYFARQISIAHGGDITVRSDQIETVFTVRLPRLSTKKD